MRIVHYVIAACLLFLSFQNSASVLASDPENSKVQKSELPRKFLPKPDGNIIMRKEGQSITLTSSRSILEDILQKIADERRVVLKFYCNDPTLKRERLSDVRISTDSMVKALQQLVPKDYQITLLNKKGQPVGENADRKEIAAVDISPSGCTQIEHPVRTFVPDKEHPLLRKPFNEISLEDLATVLKKEGPGTRRLAAEMLGVKSDEKGIPYAKDALKDESPSVMFAAVNALRRLGQKYGAEKVSNAIYDRFVEKPYPEFLPVIAELAKDRIWPLFDALIGQPGDKEQGVILKALILTNDKKAIEYLSRIAFTGSVDNSRLAIYTIGKIGGPEAEPILMRLMKEGDVQRQARAAQAVYFLPKGEGLAARAEVGRIVREEKISDVLIQALAEAPDLEIIEKIMKDKTSKPDLKMRILKVMANQGSERNMNAISACLDDPAPEVRIASVEAMGTIASEAAIPHLIRATQDSDPRVRNGAARALSGFPGDDAVVQALGKAIYDTDETVRKAAVDAIGLLGQPSEAAAAILRKSTDHKDPYVANKASSILRYWNLDGASDAMTGEATKTK
jgi:HEAT repeat protein